MYELNYFLIGNKTFIEKKKLNIMFTMLNTLNKKQIQFELNCNWCINKEK